MGEIIDRDTRATIQALAARGWPLKWIQNLTGLPDEIILEIAPEVSKHSPAHAPARYKNPRAVQ